MEVLYTSIYNLLGGFGAGAAALACMGYWWGIGDSWVLFFWRLHAALLGMPVPADVGCQPGGRTVPGLVRGGAWGSGGALPPGWGYGWAWGAWVLVGVPPEAWVGACAWARLWCGGLRCIGASAGGGGGGSNRGGVNGLYLGVLLSFVVWELTE